MRSDPWRSLMDSDSNGLSALPKIVRFQIMVQLSIMWSIIFCLAAGMFAWLPAYALGHMVLLAIGIFGTKWIFNTARFRSE